MIQLTLEALFLKAIPQMRDTADVLKLLDLSETSSKLLAIIANRREQKMLFNLMKFLIWAIHFPFLKPFR